MQALGAGSALAGGMSGPMVEPDVIEEEATTSSRAGILVPILAIILIGIAISNDGGTSTTTEGGV